MRLILPLPPPESAPRRELDAQRTLVVLDGEDERPRVTLTLYHPRIAPMSLLEWASDITRSELPPGMSSTTLSSSITHNQVGWLMQVVHSVLTRPGDATPVEARLTAIFRFQPFQTHASAAVGRILEPTLFNDWRPRLMDLFQLARPDWTGPEIACLSQLYE